MARSLRAGSLRHRIEIQYPSYAQDQYGAMTPEWKIFATVWAAIEPVSAREFVSAMAEQAKVDARIVIRHLANLTADMLIVHGDQVYDIKGILPDMDSGQKYITMPVSFGIRIDEDDENFGGLLLADGFSYLLQSDHRSHIARPEEFPDSLKLADGFFLLQADNQSHVVLAPEQANVLLLADGSYLLFADAYSKLELQEIENGYLFLAGSDAVLKLSDQSKLMRA